MKLNKYELLANLETDVNEQILTVTDHYQNATSGILTRPASNGGWSVIQCLEHLNSYGDYYLPQISAALKKAYKDDNQIYTSGWLGDYFTKIMSPETGTKKHKAFKGHIPLANLDPEKVVSEFLRQERLLLEYLKQASNHDLSVRIPISISKWISLKLGDILRFVIAHNRRHILQAQRSLNSR